MKDQKFFICRHCGNLVGMIESSGVPMVCCGEKMQELIPNTVDGAAEKHVPVVNIDGNTVNVTVGSIPHPMTEEHLIKWIYLQTNNGGQRKSLNSTDQPKATFIVDGSKPISVYAYCNIHGLWNMNLV